MGVPARFSWLQSPAATTPPLRNPERIVMCFSIGLWQSMGVEFNGKRDSEYQFRAYSSSSDWSSNTITISPWQFSMVTRWLITVLLLTLLLYLATALSYFSPQSSVHPGMLIFSPPTLQSGYHGCARSKTIVLSVCRSWAIQKRECLWGWTWWNGATPAPSSSWPLRLKWETCRRTLISLLVSPLSA